MLQVFKIMRRNTQISQRLLEQMVTDFEILFLQDIVHQMLGKLCNYDQG